MKTRSSFHRLPDFLFLLMVIVFPTDLPAQFRQPPKPPGQRPVKHRIIIRNNRSYKILPIVEGSSIILRVRGKTYDGRVWEVHGDTLVMKEIGVSIHDVDTLFFKTPQAKPNPFGPDSRPPGYVKNSPKWSVFIPPDDAYANSFAFKLYLRNLQHQNRREKFQGNDSLIYHNYLKFNLAKLAHLEIAFSYERLISKTWSWDTELSAIFGIQSADAYYTMPYPVYNYNGFSVTTVPKFRLGDSRASLGPVLMYRYLWFNDVRTDWPDEQDNGMLQDQYRNDIGLGIRLGYTKCTGQFVVDFYFGGGVKMVMIHQLIYGDYLYHDSGQMYWRHPDHSPDMADISMWQPMINLGIKIGFGF